MQRKHIIAIREHYESMLANSVLKNPKLVPAVDKVSRALIELIDANIDTAFDLSQENIAIEAEMYHPDYFGRINLPKNTCNTPLKTLGDLRAILADKNSPLPLVMHVHAVFMAKVYNKLPNKIPNSLLLNNSNEEASSYSQKVAQEIRQNSQAVESIKNSVAKKLFYNELFFKSKTIDRARQLKAEPIASSDLIGIDRSEFFMELADKSDYLHVRAADRFIPDPASNYTKLASAKNLPLVAGPSGHAGSLIMCGILCGDLTQEEMQQYGLATSAYLVGGGNHAMDEVGSVIAKVGIPHLLGEYDFSLPVSYKQSFVYRNVKMEFERLLQDNIAQKITDNKYVNLKSYSNLYQEITGEQLVVPQQIRNGTCVYPWHKLNKPLPKNPVCKINSNERNDFTGLATTYLLSSTPSSLFQSQAIASGHSSTNISSAIYGLGVSVLTFFGFYYTKPSIEVKVDMSSEIMPIHQAVLADQTLKDLGITKFAEQDMKKKELVKTFLIDLQQGRATHDIKNAFTQLTQDQNPHLRWKNLVKLANKHQQTLSPENLSFKHH